MPLGLLVHDLFDLPSVNIYRLVAWLELIHWIVFMPLLEVSYQLSLHHKNGWPYFGRDFMWLGSMWLRPKGGEGLVALTFEGRLLFVHEPSSVLYAFVIPRSPCE